MDVVKLEEFVRRHGPAVVVTAVAVWATARVDAGRAYRETVDALNAAIVRLKEDVKSLTDQRDDLLAKLAFERERYTRGTTWYSEGQETERPSYTESSHSAFSKGSE
ncbi:MAG TPA: hypothetical protein VIX63_03645 [Vicinamibacterales bacterium]